MRRAPSSFGLAAFLAAMFFLAPAAWAQDSISVTSTLTGSTVVVQATGVAPDCADDAGCNVYPYVSSSSNGTSCPGLAGDTLQGSAAITSADGSFSFSFAFSVPESTGDEYVVCGYVYSGSDAIATSQPVLVTIPATMCRPGIPNVLSINAPSEVAAGRTARIVVGYQGNTVQSVSAGTLTATLFSADTPYYSHQFSRSEISNFNNNDADESFPIPLPRHGGSVEVDVNYQQDESSNGGPPECLQDQYTFVKPVAGKTPTVHVSTYGGTISFSAPGGCSETKIVSAEIEVRGKGADSVLRSKDVCLPGSWKVHGRTSGVSTGTGVDGSGSTVTFNLVAHINRQYQMVVRVGGRVVKYVLMTTVYQNTPAMRVYQGTDAFVNYCIDQSHTIYSYNHQLFCWRPGSTTQYIILTS